MFLYQPTITKETQVKLDEIKQRFGISPPHWEFLASVAPKRFDMFMQEIAYLLNHPNIDRDFFTMLRLYVANKEDFYYCKSLNTKLLLAKGYTKEQLKRIKDGEFPLNNKHQILADKTFKAMYQPQELTLEDINELKNLLWNDSDIYDAIDHGAFLFKFARILKAYLA